ncbi:MAG: NAD(P)-dependent oxidoreductase, partial [Aquificaceae bacterium]
FMVIVAVDDLRLQKKIYGFCVKMGIHCNAVDTPDFCTFLFPALVVRGNLVIGVSTSGKVPALSAGIRELIEKELPQNIEDLLSELEGLRESLPEGMERQEKLIALVRQRLGL